jgi:hypothetical protein
METVAFCRLGKQKAILSKALDNIASGLPMNEKTADCCPPSIV